MNGFIVFIALRILGNVAVLYLASGELAPTGAKLGYWTENSLTHRKILSRVSPDLSTKTQLCQYKLNQTQSSLFSSLLFVFLIERWRLRVMEIWRVIGKISL